MALSHDYDDQLVTAHFECLMADDDLKAKLKGEKVYNYVEQGRPSPYIVIGSNSSINNGDHDYNGQELSCPFEIFWPIDDLKTGNLILADVIRILDRKELEMPDFCTRFNQYAGKEPFVNVDNELQLRSIVARFKIIITEIT